MVSPVRDIREASPAIFGETNKFFSVSVTSSCAPTIPWKKVSVRTSTRTESISLKSNQLNSATSSVHSSVVSSSSSYFVMVCVSLLSAVPSLLDDPPPRYFLTAFSKLKLRSVSLSEKKPRPSSAPSASK